MTVLYTISVSKLKNIYWSKMTHITTGGRNNATQSIRLDTVFLNFLGPNRVTSVLFEF